ncbi:P-loop containing nucleoside triphosphate hydrolase protein [Penicillium angulare]|uniref:P-loop containing nucleoside triphosphate hydrolase protein n=1 Tax=Penicillium angulare TaxID=116970 RepID=A0A9W9KJ51_9EURO|nr:P-loop containing nucleoside triphosphate hydrolase protein [Penicillium angulare]
MADICSQLESADKAFGPQIQGCDSLKFDFTLLFEQVVLSMIPTACFIPMAACRLWWLLKQSLKVTLQPNKQGRIAIFCKLILNIASFLANIVLLVIWTITPQLEYRNKATIISVPLSLICSLCTFALSWTEHRKSVAPSNIICFYLTCSILLDTAQARTLWLRDNLQIVAVTFTAALAIRFLILVAELQEKQQYLTPPFSTYPPEVLAGMVNRVLFWWLNPLLLRGARGLLNSTGIFPIDSSLQSTGLQEKFVPKWQSKSKPQNDHVLARAVFSCVRETLLLSAIPRVSLIGFKIFQPLLLHRVIDYLSSTDDKKKSVGKALIGAIVLVYVGIAATTLLYKHGINRAITEIRGILIVALYNKTQSLDAATLKESAAITLMSTDTETICSNLLRLDALFASPIEVGLALFLLEKQVSLACLAPAGCALAAVALGYIIASCSPWRQKKWNEVVQDRVATTASVLRSIQSVKLLGISPFVQRQICDLRDLEFKRSRGARILMMWRNFVGNIPHIVGPVLTFTIFAIINGSGAVTSAHSFTTLALISLVTQPIQVFVHGIAQLGAALGCFMRIQEYLLLPELDSGLGSHDSTHDQIATRCKGTDTQDGRMIPLKAFPAKNSPYISMRNAAFKYLGSTKPVLTDVTMDIYPGTLTIVTGSVGSGKTSLLKGIIGTLPCVAGSQNTSSVIGSSCFEEKWYNAVLHACALDEDIALFPRGDSTQVGSGGTALSGGQKQRLTIARAAYSRRKLLVLDETLSSLDIVTAKKVYSRMLGAQGLCRSYNGAVILACNDFRPYTAANVITLGNGTVISHGTSNLPPEYECSIFHTDEGTAPDEIPPEAAKTEIELVKARDDLSRRDGDLSLYKYYLRSIGWGSSVVLLGLTVLITFGSHFPTLWLMYWTSDEFHYPLGIYLGVYGACSGIQTIAMMISIIFLFVVLVPKSGRRLHSQLLMATLKAPYTFFTKHDSETLLNKFSQDLSQIDNQLSGSLFMALIGLNDAIAEVMLIAAGSEYIAIAVPFMILVIYGLQKFYLRTSRQLRFLQLEAQSPLYTHFLETASGVDTIRTFGWESIWAAQCHSLVDAALRPYYALYCIQRWLNLVLDLIAAADSLSYLITAWIALETSLGAVSRIKSHQAVLPKEDDSSKPVSPPAEDWPTHGSIQFDHAYASYETEEPPETPILRDITASIHTGQKVAICGRTGSGKSSLMLRLFRLLKTTSGDVLIDGINLSDIPCAVIRERLNIFPQDALTLPGTLRFNLDPEGKAPDNTLVSSLKTVGLWEHLKIYSQTPLDLLAGDANFTRGQWQLMSLARALVRKTRTKILVLDEISGQVDVETERLMFQIIRDHFKDATVIAVTHRLRCIQDFDKVLILKEDQVVETGAPAHLLIIPSLFKELWDEQ